MNPTTFLLSSLLAVLAAAVPAANPAADATAACDCQHNGDAGRWNDAADPAGRLASLCSNGGGCWQATAGRMCVNGDLNQCPCAIQSAQEWQSWHGDWFLWSAVSCGGLTVTIT